MEMILAGFALFLCGVQGAEVATPARPTPGDCPTTPTPMKEFDVKQFSGHWYFSLLDTTPENESKCNQVMFHGNDSTIEMHLVTHLISTAKPTSIKLYSAVSDDGAANFSFPTSESNKDLRLHFVVLDTDYKSHAVVYTCMSYQSLYMNHTEILSRTPTLDKKNQGRVDEVLTLNGLKTLKDLVPTVQDCGLYSCEDDGMENCAYSSLKP